MLKPRMSSLWPLKSCLTRLMTPSVLILHAKKRSGRAGEPFPVATQIIHCQWQHSEPLGRCTQARDCYAEFTAVKVPEDPGTKRGVQPRHPLKASRYP